LLGSRKFLMRVCFRLQPYSVHRKPDRADVQTDAGQTA
jgi:hypothetical protein